MITKTFRIITFRDGTQYPSIHIHPRKFDMLYELGMGRLSKSENVKSEIYKLQEVQKGLLSNYQLSSGDWCVVHVGKNASLITNNFDEFEPIEIPTSEILTLMEDWYEFLLAYETGEIPGIVPPSKR